MSERRMSDSMWEAARLLWNGNIPGWMIADYYGISIAAVYRRAREDERWKDRSAYIDRRINPERRTHSTGGRRMTDAPQMRCQDCQQRYQGTHVCSGRRIA